MNFTFGIITGASVPHQILDSIINQNILEYEILIIGGKDDYEDYDVNYISFDESLGKFTKKKNLITENAKFDNIVYMHDYYILDDNWYKGLLKFGDDWDLCMNIIENKDGTRFRDWCAWNDPEFCFDTENQRIVLPSYDYNKHKYMYISGGYWISKKYVMEEEPLNENLDWGESEDVEWSKRVLPKYVYMMNKYSKVKLLKDKRLSADVLNTSNDWRYYD